jgi:hypothetical protein
MADQVAVKPPAGVRFGVLGPLQVVDGSGASRVVAAAKQRVVLAALLLGAGQITSPWDEADALVGLGRCARADGDIQQGISLLTQAHQIFHRIGAADAAKVAAERDDLAGQATPGQRG